MAIIPASQYPGQITPASTGYPYGSARDVSSPGAGDGTPVNQAWVNDSWGFLQRLLQEGGVTPSGSPDTVVSSDYFNALEIWVRSQSNGVVGDSRNIVMSVPTPATSATLTADQVVVAESLTGKQYRVNNVSKTINLGTTGAGGMDTGAAPNPGFVAIYLIYNPATDASALLATNATSSVASTVYAGANMPSGYTASALVSVWRTFSGTLAPGLQQDRKVIGDALIIVTSSVNVSTLTPVVASGAVPPNAKSISGYGTVNSVEAAANNFFRLASSSLGLGSKLFGTNNSGIQISFENLLMATPQTIYYGVTFGGTPNSASITCTGYTI